MSVFRPSELRQFLDSLGVRARKSLSQNFLIDGNILRKIVAAAAVDSEDLVIEIGPGPGALTEFLLQAGARVIAIEKDRIFAKALERFGSDRLQIFEADALEFDLAPFFGHPSIKVVANLPYQLTSPLLGKLVPLAPHVKSLTLMVQKEVADRITAKAGTEDYSSLSIFIELFAKARLCFPVEPTCFYPRPKVRSAVVHLELHPPPLDLDADAFIHFVRTAFGQRRKTLRSSLRSLFPPEAILAALKTHNLSEDTRPEELSLGQFLELFRTLAHA